MDLWFFISSAALGFGLAMDAFSVSLANGLAEPGMRKWRIASVAGVYAFFQFLMPLIGWFCVHEAVQVFSALERFIPWIALLLLLYIGGKMLLEGLRPGMEEGAMDVRTLTVGMLLLQGIATSIDALSVGFTIADYGFAEAFFCALIVALVTFAICTAGLLLGRTLGTRLAGRASILGGVILIGIGVLTFTRGVLL